MVFDGLQIGGIERVGVDYAKLVSEVGHDLSIINLRRLGLKEKRRIIILQYQNLIL